MISLSGWPILIVQLVLAAIVGALIDRWYSGVRRLENNERFRNIVTNVMAIMFMVMVIFSERSGGFNPDASFRLLRPEYPRNFTWANAFQWIDMLLFVILLVLPFMASHRISDAKVKRRYLAASLAMFVIAPLWLILSIVWSMK